MATMEHDGVAPAIISKERLAMARNYRDALAEYEDADGALRSDVLDAIADRIVSDVVSGERSHYPRLIKPIV